MKHDTWERVLDAVFQVDSPAQNVKAARMA